MYKTYILCYVDMNSNTVWESIYSEVAMEERVYDLAEQFNCDILDILVFDYDTELFTSFRRARKFDC